MANMQVIKDQKVASTLTDSQGEKLTLADLKKLLKNSNDRGFILLGEEHDLANRHKGYINNFRIIKSDTEEDEYYLIADVYYQNDANGLLGGISWSLIEHFPGQEDESDLHVYLPYPYYKENDYLTDLKSHDGFALGSWKKKSADPNTIGLIYATASFVLGPVWNSIYEKQVEPRLAKLFKILSAKKPVNLKYDYIQSVFHPLGYDFRVYFLLSKIDSKVSMEPFRFRYGIEVVRQYIENTEESKRIHMITMVYIDELKGFQIWAIEYHDGNKVYLI